MKTLSLIICIFAFFPSPILSALQENVDDKIKLAEKYRKELKYDQAYHIYKELSDSHPDNIDYLASCADLLVFMGNEPEALNVYQKVLAADPENLNANIFMGNYYYLMAELKRAGLEEEFQKIPSPNKSNHAEFKKEMNLLYITTYSKAKTYLEKVVLLFPSSEAKRTLEKIGRIEKYLQSGKHSM